MMQIRKAQRRKAKLRLGIAAPSGAGKTYSSLLLAFGLGKKIGLIDTEHGSGDLYAHLGEYDVISLEPPYTVRKYLDAMKTFEAAEYDVIVIDSLSHAWAGEGGLLDKQGKLEESGKFRNSFATWREITPEHNNLVNAILSSPAHVIATMRSKVEYVLDQNSNGKTAPKKVGMAPVMRDGIEYEFTVMLDIDQKHNATASKDRTGLFDGEIFKITKDTGAKLLAWLEAGSDVMKELLDEIMNAPDEKTLQEIRAGKLVALWPTLSQASREKIQSAFTDKTKILTTPKETQGEVA